MNKIKEYAINDYINMVKKSWTYDRMNETEKINCINALSESDIKGNYNQRWEILNIIYRAFLLGLGYNGFNWREAETQPFLSQWQ